MDRCQGGERQAPEDRDVIARQAGVGAVGQVLVAEVQLEWARLRRHEGQELAAKHSLRPRSAKVLAKYSKQFPKLQLFTVDELFGGWKKAQKEHFDDGALYDQIIASAKK